MTEPGHPPPPPEVFAYLDFRAFLRDWYDWKKLRNPRYSHRLFARKAGFRSPSTFLNVVDGRRNPSAAMAESFALAMDLDAEATSFFLALVRLTCADDALSREAALEQVRATTRFRDARKLDSNALEFLAKWYLPALYELASCGAIPNDPDTVAGLLRPAISGKQAREAIASLVALDLLAIRGDTLVRAEGSLVTPHEAAGVAVRQYHRSMIERARDALEYAPRDRHLCAITVAIPSGMIPRLKQELDAIQERLLQMCDGSSDTKTMVAQINLQLIPLSVDVGGKS